VGPVELIGLGYPIAPTGF